MKKIVGIIFIIFVLLCIPMTVFAGNNVIIGMPIQDELGEYSDSIYEDYCKMLEQTEEQYQPSESDIKYDRGARIYFDMPLLEKNELTRADMEEFTRISAYMYLIPVQFNGKDAEILLSKGFDAVFDNRYNLNMPENFYKFYFNDKYDWKIGTVDYDYYFYDYNASVNELLDDYDIEDSEVYIVNNIGGHTKHVFVIFRQNSDIAEFIVFDDLINHSKIVPDTEFGKRTYTYSELKELDIIKANSAEYNVGSGYATDTDTDFQYALIAGGAVLGLCALALIINFASKKKVKV